MSFWKKAKQATILNRLLDEKLHEQVLHEMEAGIRRDGLWAKALRKSRGNEQEAKGVYIGLRIQSIEDEAEIVETLSQHSPAQNITAPKERNITAPKKNLYVSPKERLDVSGICGYDMDTVTECATLVSTYGYTLSGSRDNWSIKVNGGTQTTYCYSMDDLEETVKKLGEGGK